MTEVSSFPTNIQKLIELQMELECKKIQDGNLLISVPCPQPDDIPRVLVLENMENYMAYFRHDLPCDLRRQLSAFPFSRLFSDQQLVISLLAPHEPCEHIWHGTSYVFPSTFTPGLYPEAVQLDDERHYQLLQQYEHWKRVDDKVVYGIILDGHIVASCGSVRENDKSAEAWVITEPDFCGRGFARQVTAAWAHHLQRHNKVPFYSHAQQNMASQALARSLGLAPFLTACTYS